MNALRRFGVFLGCALALARPVWAAGVPEEWVTAGVGALKEERFDEARRWFSEGLAAAEASGDASRLGRAHFYLGLSDQQQARAEEEARPRAALLESALGHYGRALEASPESAGTLNNLSRVQRQLGRTNEALASLSKAVQVNDPRRGYYAEQYADLLLQAGRWRDACQYYALVAVEQPQNRLVHDKMVDACLKHGPDLLGWYLWELVRSGQVIQVQDHVLRVLTEPIWSPDQRDELLALLAYSLARKNETVGELQDSPVGRRLRELVDHPEVGAGVSGVLHLYQDGVLNPAQVAWWTRRAGGNRELRRGVWPFEAFLDLIRSRGDQAGAEGDRERREQFYRFAVEVRPDAPDPQALLGLANLYAERRETNKIENLLRKHQVDIFAAKGQAYSQARTENIYRYHMALGVIYSELKRWTSPGQIDSALFQLRRAIETAEYMNEQAGGGGGGGGAAALGSPVVVPTRLVELLADGYQSTGQAENAVRLRFDQAERYLKQDQAEAAARVMAPLKSQLLAPPGPGNMPGLPAAAAESYRVRWKAIDAEIEKRRLTPPVAPLGRVQVRVAPEAMAVVGGANRVPLSEMERKTLESAISNAVGREQSNRLAPGKSSTVRSLKANGVASDVQEVTVQGSAGRVLLRRGTNLIQVPFQVSTATNTPTPNLRLIRP